MHAPPLPMRLHALAPMIIGALFLIAEAPVRRGEAFGPCLLMLAAEWIIGSWDGDGWFCAQGLPVQPMYYAELPTIG